MSYQPITDAADPLLTVWIDREQPSAQVYFTYGYEDAEDQPTPYQTADMPLTDATAWRMVDSYAEGMAG